MKPCVYGVQLLDEMVDDETQNCFVNQKVLDRFRSFGGVRIII